uniref:Uncharacterized protein LOC114346472 n=1 Tax=Diabrotica virgifera virgifera TaxID=50390 RepID=A0A6P7GU18_DIAVI
MVLSCDDKYLITASTEGILTFWKLLNTEDKAIKLDLISSSEILISKQILEDKMMQIRNLQIRMKELETEHSYQIRQTDALAASRLKDVHKEYCNAIEELKLKNEQMEAEHIQEINNINAQISQMKSNHELVLQKLEATYNEKLIAEYEKFVSYENKMNRMLADVNMRYTELQKAKDESEAAITEDYEIKLQEAKLLYDEVSFDVSHLVFLLLLMPTSLMKIGHNHSNQSLSSAFLKSLCV